MVRQLLSAQYIQLSAFDVAANALMHGMLDDELGSTRRVRRPELPSLTCSSAVWTLEGVFSIFDVSMIGNQPITCGQMGRVALELRTASVVVYQSL